MRRIVVCMLAAFVAICSVAVSHADTYKIDKDHSSVGFAVRHLGIANVKGTFGDYEAVITFDGENIESLGVSATIQAASIDTAQSRRDNHLRSADFFEVETYPTITFKSESVEPEGEGHVLVGSLTIKDVTQTVRLPVSLGGPIEDPWGHTRISLDIGGSLLRHDYGVGFDGMSDRGIGKEIRIEIFVAAVKE